MTLPPQIQFSSWRHQSAFETNIQTHTLKPVRIRWHQNRHTMIRITPVEPLGWKVSLHSTFSSAPMEVQRALATYLNTRRRDAWAVVRQFAESIPIPPLGDAILCRTEGTHHNLADIQEKIEALYFEGQSVARISWKTYRKRREKGKRRCIRFGQYDPVENLIWVNDLLDQPHVPRGFVEFIAYHESLHAIHPPVRQGRRTVYHHSEFRKQEREFPNYEHMQMLSGKLLHQLD